MSIADKLRSILTIKNQLKNEIAAKGVNIDSSTPFSQYPAKIKSMYVVIDNTPPTIDSFDFVVAIDKTATITGKTESGATIVLKNPNGVVVPLTINPNGAFSGYIPADIIAGIYTLTVTDPAGNVTIATKNAVIPTDKIKALFTTGTQGVYYDFNDLSTMFQDAAGTIPVTTVGQTVGKVLDKSGKGWNLVENTVSKQPKLAKNAISGSYYLMFDGIDDNFYLTTGVSYNHVDSTLFVSADYRVGITGYLGVHCFTASSGWGVAVTSRRTNITSGGVRSSLNDFISPCAFNHLSADPTKNTLELYCGQTETYMKNNTETSRIAGIVYTAKFDSFFVSPDTKGAIYKIVLINRKLTPTESADVRTVMNAAMGI